MDNLESMRINCRDRIVDFGRDVQQPILRTEHWAMRADAMIKLKVAHNLARRDVDNDHVAAVGARFADAGVAVDRNVSKFAIRRCDHLVARRSSFGNGCHLLTRIGINDPESLISLIGDQQHAPRHTASQRGSRPNHDDSS